MWMKGTRTVAFSAVVAWSLVSVPQAQADVGIGEWVITRGNTIEVVGPDASVDLQDLVDGITDAAADNRYLITLGPGVYELGASETLALAEYVDLTGSGQATTEIIGSRTSGGGSCGFSHGVVAVPNNSVLSHLTVTLDTDSTSNGYAVCNFYNTTTPTIRSVTARALSTSDQGSRYAFHFIDSSPQLFDVTAIADGGDNAYGLYCNSSDVEVSRAWLEAKNGVTRNRAIWMVGTCSLEIRDLTLKASDAPENIGIQVQTGTEINVAQGLLEITGSGGNFGIQVAGTGKVTLHDTRIRPTGGATNTGIEVTDDAALRVFRSTLGGNTTSLDTDSSVDAIFGQSTLFSGVSGTGAATCQASDNGQGDALDSACAVIP